MHADLCCRRCGQSPNAELERTREAAAESGDTLLALVGYLEASCEVQ